jgi:hypothetical protein
MASPLAVFTIMAVRLASGLAHIALDTVILFGVLKLPIADGREMTSGKQLSVSAATLLCRKGFWYLQFSNDASTLPHFYYEHYCRDDGTYYHALYVVDNQTTLQPL